MCRNKKHSYFVFSFLRTVLPAFFFFLVMASASAWAVETQVHLIMGDYNTKLAINAVKAIRQAYPQLTDELHFTVVTSATAEAVLADKTAGKLPVGVKGIAILHIMDRRLVESLKPYIQRMIRSGVRVYAIGGLYGKEHKELGLIDDETVNAYYRENGLENITQMLLYLLQRDCGTPVTFQKPVKVPQSGIYLKEGGRTVESFAEFQQLYRQRPGPWVGITFYKNLLDNADTAFLDSLIDSLERQGMNVLPVYTYPSELAVERFMFDENGKSRVQAVVGLSLKIGLTPQRAIPILSRLGVPVIDAVNLYSQSRAEWEKSPVGLNIFERSSSVGLPELAGIIQPTVVASRELTVDRATGLQYFETRPIPERIERLTARITRWLTLQQKRNSDKQIALIYYNYPPGKQNIGASYLNVLPESLYEIVTRLKAEGYDTGNGEITKDRLFENVFAYGRNIGNWAPAEIDRLARSGRAVLVPMTVYKSWFMELPEGFRKAVVKDWGEPDASSIMTWSDPNGKKFIVIPAVRYGNILFTPQPARGWEQDIKKLYHDVTIAPHHQYVAFYLWLKLGFKADAVAHIGTHGTHEWLSGKEVGFTNEDPPELLIQDLPNIYPYIVDDVGEGLQAKRRGMGVVIDYMTPPFDKAGMNRDLKELAALISDYSSAKEKSQQLAAGKLEEINRIVAKNGMLTDLKLKAIRTDDEVEALGDYIEEISETNTPFGLHTFGKSPEAKYRHSTAEAIISIEKGMTPAEHGKRIAALEDAIERSGPRELDSFVAALAGKYIPAGTGNDPIRNPDSLPTGKNFYSFDPAWVPSPGVYETGAKLAKDMIEGYKKRHGVYPDKLTYNLWATETIRHEGVMESQIMYLMGVRPQRDERGRVKGVEAIPREELGRPRIDVTIVPSGLYRDIFPMLMSLLDNAVSVARDQDEQDNLVRSHTLKTQKMLMAKGVAEDKAERMASVRIFTEPSGAYGTNLDKVIVASDSWDNEKQVVDVYFMRMSYMYGQGFWSDKEKQGSEDLGDTLLKNALSGSKIAIHSRSTNTIGVLDTDDFFQYLGGTAMAIRAVDGKTPEVYVTNMTNPKKAVQETIEKTMGREMRARYLNPEWIKAMMKEGYAGARFVDKVTENLWGWQVTVPEAVDSAKWQEMYETWVLDRNGLGIKELFRQSKNMTAYESLVARMLETVRKQYWKPDQKVVETLAREYAESVREVGLACCEHTCNNPKLTHFTSVTLLSIPGMRPLQQSFAKALDMMKKSDQGQQAKGARKSANAAKEAKQVDKKTAKGRQNLAPGGKGDAKAKNKSVSGFEMQEVGTSASGASSASIPWMFIIGFVFMGVLVMIGFRKR
jgi:cobaltochelatase CobN